MSIIGRKKVRHGGLTKDACKFTKGMPGTCSDRKPSRVVHPVSVQEAGRMRATLYLYAGLEKHVRDYTPAEGILLELDHAVLVEEIVSRFALPRREVGIVAVNGKRASLKHAIQDGDRIGLFSFVTGG
jgi:sulfur carrier protein ThiS